MERSDHIEALLEVTRLVQHETDLRELLPGVAAALSRAFGYGIVVISICRPATHEIESIVVHGGGPDAQSKQGNVTPLSAWAPLAITAVTRLERVRYEATHDTLTDLGNRRSLHAALERLERDAGCALLVVDLDDFKAVNDGLGHAAGDEMLAAVARTIRTNLRAGDVAFRLGGDEFAVVMRETTPAQAAGVRRRLERAIAGIEVGGARVGASIGVACGHGARALLDTADARMYEVKRRRGRRPASQPR